MGDWLNKNIASVIDLVIVIGTIGLAFFVLGGLITPIGVYKEMIFYVFGALMALVTSIVGYHRGSSQGSKDKDAHARSLELEQNNAKK